MSEQSFEDEYLDVLQNIEIGIVRVYQAQPELTDWDALSAIEALLQRYTAEARGRSPAKPRLPEMGSLVYFSVAEFTEWRLGHGHPRGVDSLPRENPTPVTVHEMIACLKRIRKSINLWNREQGQRGYLTFVSEFIR